MKEEVRQILERELGNALVDHAVVIQRGIRRYRFRKVLKLTLAARSITRAFKKIQTQTRITEIYATKYYRSKKVIEKAFKNYLLKKREKELEKAAKENNVSDVYDRTFKQIEDERKQLDEQRKEHKEQIDKLDDTLPDDLKKSMNLGSENDYIEGDSDLYEDFKGSRPSDGLASNSFGNESLENQEIKDLQEKVKELEGQLSTLEEENSELKIKEIKSTNNTKYLEWQVQDYQTQIEELKNKNKQLLNFNENISNYMENPTEGISNVNEEEFERLKALCDSLTEENKALKDENDRK